MKEEYNYDYIPGTGSYRIVTIDCSWTGYTGRWSWIHTGFCGSNRMWIDYLFYHPSIQTKEMSSYTGSFFSSFKTIPIREIYKVYYGEVEVTGSNPVNRVRF